MVLEAFREALREIRDLEEKSTREYLAIARRAKNTRVRIALYALLAEKLLHTEILRGIYKAYDRLDDLEYEFRQAEYGASEEKESYEVLLRLEELQGIQTRVIQLLQHFMEDMDRPLVRRIIEIILDNEKQAAEQLESIINDVRMRVH